MCSCNICGAVVDLTGIGSAGATGATGAAGADGVSIEAAVQSVLSTATTGSWVATSFSETIEANDLATNGDFMELDMLVTGGSTSITNIDGVKIVINGTSIVNPDTSYVTSANDTWHVPYAISETPIQFKMKFVRVSSTTTQILLYTYGKGVDATRMDIYSTAFTVNNLTSATNTIAVSIYNTTASNCKIYDIKLLKYKI